MVFNDKKSAAAYLRGLDFLTELANGAFIYNKEYALKDEEVSSPHFYPTRFKQGWFVKVIHFYKYGKFTKREDGKCVFKGHSYVVIEAMP